MLQRISRLGWTWIRIFSLTCFKGKQSKHSNFFLSFLGTFYTSILIPHKFKTNQKSLFDDNIWQCVLGAFKQNKMLVRKVTKLLFKYIKVKLMYVIAFWSLATHLPFQELELMKNMLPHAVVVSVKHTSDSKNRSFWPGQNSPYHAPLSSSLHNRKYLHFVANY